MMILKNKGRAIEIVEYWTISISSFASANPGISCDGLGTPGVNFELRARNKS